MATALTAEEMAGSRMARVTSVPPTRTYSSCGLVLISSGRSSAACSTAAASSRSMPCVQAVPGQGTVHGAGVQVGEPQPARHFLADAGFAGPGRAVDGHHKGLSGAEHGHGFDEFLCHYCSTRHPRSLSASISRSCLLGRTESSTMPTFCPGGVVQAQVLEVDADLADLRQEPGDLARACHPPGRSARSTPAAVRRACPECGTARRCLR